MRRIIVFLYISCDNKYSNNYKEGKCMRVFEGFQKGINLGGWISQCVSMEPEHFKTFITEEDIKRIAGWKLDHVRVPVDYDIVVTDEGQWKEKGLFLIDSCIKWCKAAGINMILDLHKTKGYMFDSNEVENADRFFKDSELQDFFVDIWKFFAERYAAYSDMLAFELLNEITNPDFCEAWNRIALRAIKEIRNIAPDNYIIVGGTNYNSVTRVPELPEPYDDKIVYNFHCYEPLVFTHQKASWMACMPKDFEMKYPATVEEMRAAGSVMPKEVLGAINESCLDGHSDDFFDALFAAAVKTAKERNVPLYCGEYGVIDQAPAADSLVWIKTIHQAFEKYHIGRALWTYKNRDFGLLDEHYDPIREEMIKNL
jgi:hypothetical protein